MLVAGSLHISQLYLTQSFAKCKHCRRLAWAKSTGSFSSA